MAAVERNLPLYCCHLFAYRLNHLGNRTKQNEHITDHFDQSTVFVLLSIGGDEGDRTPYLLHAMQALSQVSYTPICFAELDLSRRRFIL